MDTVCFRHRKQSFYSDFLLKMLFVMLILAFSQKSAFAQTIQYYGFSQSSDTYTELSSPIEIVTPTAQSGTGSVDDQVYTLPDGTRLMLIRR